MDVAGAFRRALAAGDVDEVWRLWKRVAPHLPQATDRAQAEVMMHLARTQSGALPLRPRAYSHRWLLERGLPSQLPDALRPRAERLYPTVVEAVGIAVRPSRLSADHALAVRQAMEGAVLDKYADGDRDPVRVAALMKERADRVRAQ